MKKMQRARLKIVIPLIALIFLSWNDTLAQSYSFRLKTADSLYLAKQYTQSFEHYRTILDQRQYSPSMLLKMAFIQEGLNNIGQAMYYLNLYLLATNDKSVMEKMEDLATKYNLEGYQTSDADRFLSFYHDHYSNISIALAALTLLLFSIIFYTRIRLHRGPVVSGFFAMVFMIALFIHLNFGDRISAGIITSTTTYVMDGPSAGASVVEIIKDGHRVEITGKHDVWLKILWNGETAYVRNNCLQPLKL